MVALLNSSLRLNCSGHFTATKPTVVTEVDDVSRILIHEKFCYEEKIEVPCVRRVMDEMVEVLRRSLIGCRWES